MAQVHSAGQAQTWRCVGLVLCRSSTARSLLQALAAHPALSDSGWDRVACAVQVRASGAARGHAGLGRGPVRAGRAAAGRSGLLRLPVLVAGAQPGLARRRCAPCLQTQDPAACQVCKQHDQAGLVQSIRGQRESAPPPAEHLSHGSLRPAPSMSSGLCEQRQLLLGSPLKSVVHACRISGGGASPQTCCTASCPRGRPASERTGRSRANT